MGFSQSLSMVPAGGDIITENQISADRDILRVYAKSKKFRYHNPISQNKNPTSQLQKQGLRTLSIMTLHRLLSHHLLNACLGRLPQFLVGLHYVWVIECWTSHFYMQIRISILIRLKLFFSRSFSHFIFCLCIKLSIKKNTTNYKYLAKDIRCQLLFQVVIH